MRVQVDGGSHALRLIDPFPPRIVAAQGAWLKDEDGHDVLDFWQGHVANILGHNPKVISSVLAVLVALTWGFSAVLWLGAAAYAGALVAFGPLTRLDGG